MPITKQAQKAMRRDARKRVHNLRRKRTMKEAVKSVQEGKKDDLAEAYKAIDKATKSGVIKKNTAARKKSRLARIIAKK